MACFFPPENSSPVYSGIKLVLWTQMYIMPFVIFVLDLIDVWCFNATFNNISAISWRPVLVVEEAGVPGENHLPWASNW